nr:MAG: major capsid protein [Microvirus sp.]
MKSQPSVMKHQFSEVPKAEIPRASFDRSHGLKTTFDSGWLIPILVDEVLPGDTFNLDMTGFARLATPIKPFMDNVFMETFFFAVPNRLIWDNWKKFNGEQTNPDDSTDFTIPTITSGGAPAYQSESIYDYMGIPTGIPTLTHSALWLRAYNLIYNEWFRDQNLQNSVINNTGDGPDPNTDYTILRRGKRHDYFTSALPWPQKGDAVDLPLGSSADIHSAAGSAAPLSYFDDITQDWVGMGATSSSVTAASEILTEPVKLYADLSTATSATINELRQSFQIQKMLERDARGGTRYTEIIKAHFGVTSPDARLQRPEYLGGGSSPININPVAQTVGSSDVQTTDTPQGNLAAIGTAELHNHGFTKSFTEHCVLLGLVSVRADLTYQQGLNRMWSRQTRFDFYWPALSHIGEQAIKNKEIYAQGSVDAVADEATFGFQERFAEYRYKPSQITGKFRSTDPQTLDIWHLSQDFANLPVLGPAFIEDNPPIDRVVAVVDEPQFLFDGYFKLKTARPMPLYGVPGLIDHF